MSENTHIGKHIEEAIKGRGISKAELSRRTKISEVMINNIIRGANASVKTLDALGKELGFVVTLSARKRKTK